MRGIGEGELSGTNNNAYKAAVLFKEAFNTKGMDITVTKHIPLGGGLGGSSADIAGVLNALKKLFDVSEDVKPLADRLGSDSGYLLTGGFARLGGRGEKVSKIDSEADFFVVLVYSESGVNTADCFKLYDQMKTDTKPSDNQKLEDAIRLGDIRAISSEVGNDLSLPAQRLCGEVEKNLNAIKSLSPLCASVSGSGATVFGIFETEELSRWACDKLLKQGYDAEVVKTVTPKI
jgi:4-diphosphocytidyl-2C-methyl-D-erythritol kinase